jgi:hypothetical protein
MTLIRGRMAVQPWQSGIVALAKWRPQTVAMASGSALQAMTEPVGDSSSLHAAPSRKKIRRQPLSGCRRQYLSQVQAGLAP